MSVTDALLDILIVLVAAKVAAELMERINIPAVVGEILAGILIGPSALDLVSNNDVLAGARRNRRDPAVARGRIRARAE